MKIAIAVSVSISILCFTEPLTAQWRYTDDKGNSKTVTLKMDVPAQYRNSAVYVGDQGNGVSSSRASEEAAPAGDQKPLTLVPGLQWWRYPVGSPERAAAKSAAEQKAAELRARATAAGAPEPAASATVPSSSNSGYSAAAAEQDAAKRVNDISRCQALVNRESSRTVPGGKIFKADAGSGLTYGTDAARFEFEKCTARQ